MEENFSPQQSLQLIDSMIKKVRNDISENRFYFLFWGWLSFLAILTQFFLKAIVGYRHHYLVWLAVIPGGYRYCYPFKESAWPNPQHLCWRQHEIPVDGIGISFFVLSFVISKTSGGWLIAYPFFILFYGLGTFVSGMFLKFRPLIVGGVINWVLACICVFLPYDYQLLVAAAAILTSYIIPGHIIQTNRK
jgi:hypothetical protein